MIFFSTKEDPNLSLRFVSQLSDYKPHFNFYQLANLTPDQMKAMNIQKDPQLALVISNPQGEINLIPFSKSLHVNNLLAFMNSLGLEKLKKRPNLLEISSQGQLDAACQDKICLIGLLNYVDPKKKLDQVKLLKTLKSKLLDPQFELVHMNGYCHLEIFEQIEQTEQVPYLLGYDAKKKKVFYMFGTFEQESLVQFVKRVGDNKV